MTVQEDHSLQNDTVGQKEHILHHKILLSKVSCKNLHRTAKCGSSIPDFVCKSPQSIDKSAAYI